MNKEEWDLVKEVSDKIITIDDLVDKSNRTLVFGRCVRKRRYHHVYIKDGKIHTFRYDESLDPKSMGLLKIYDNADYVDYVDMYLQYCDFEFIQLISCRVDLYRISGEFNDYVFDHFGYNGVFH